MNLLIDQSGYRLANVGDAAMLQVAVQRMRSSGPMNDVMVLNSDAERFEAMGLCGRSLSVVGKGVFFRRGSLVDPWTRHFKGGSESALDFEHNLRFQHPKVYAAVLRARLVRQSMASRGVGEFYRAIDRADALCVSGGGFINDSFQAHGLSVLELAEWFLKRGKPVGLFGQGIGPVRSPILREQIAKIIPQCSVVGLREGVTGPRVLEELSVMGDNVFVTGDDAIEIAHASPADSDFGGPKRIGLNLRVASYSGLPLELGGKIVNAVRESASHLATDVQPVPISWHDGDSDVGFITKSLSMGKKSSDEIVNPLSPEGVVRLLSRCRVVLTGSYHAGVFALSRGIPVIAVSASEYYDAKFVGLSHAFGGEGVRIVRPEEVADSGKLLPILEDSMKNQEELKERLTRYTLSQIEASKALYFRYLGMLGNK